MWKFVLPRVALLQRYNPLLVVKLEPNRLRNMHRHVSFLFAMAAITTSFQPMVTFADASAQLSIERSRREECPVHGCPLLPQDIFFDVEVKSALENLRSHTKKDIDFQVAPVLKTSGDYSKATLTLIGYKGGSPESQVNQDRALVLSPFSISPSLDTEELADDLTANRLLGVFDGHAPLGELVSEFVVRQLPKLLASKLENVGDDEDEATKQALIETFIELDKTAPAETSGGCTASVILQLHNKVYVANAGDSLSFIAVYHASTQTTQVVYLSREDKPDLPEERRRVESMGGKVYISPHGATSRVLYMDPSTGHQSGLAMSRSIGDWEAGKVGVIAEPIVDVIDISRLVENEVNSCMVMDEHGVMNPESCGIDDIHVFAVSATDGMMDFLDLTTVAQTMAASLFDPSGSHPLTACEVLISAAASGWQRAKQGRYRDDIAIAVSTLRIPPTSSSLPRQSDETVILRQ